MNNTPEMEPIGTNALVGDELLPDASRVVPVPIGNGLFLQYHFEGMKISPTIAQTGVNLEIARRVGIQPVSFAEVMDQLGSIAGECKTIDDEGNVHIIIPQDRVDLDHITLSDEIMGDYGDSEKRTTMLGNIWRVLSVGKNDRGETSVTLQHCGVMGDRDTESIDPLTVSIYLPLFTSVKAWDKKINGNSVSLAQAVDYSRSHSEYEEGRLSEKSVVFRADGKGILQHASY